MHPTPKVEIWVGWSKDGDEAGVILFFQDGVALLLSSLVILAFFSDRVRNPLDS